MIKRHERTETIRHIYTECANPNCYCIENSFHHSPAAGSFRVTELEVNSMIEHGFIPISKTKAVCSKCFLLDFYSDKKYTNKAIKYLNSVHKDNPYNAKLQFYITDLTNTGRVVEHNSVYYGIN